MRKCQACGRENPDDQDFCECGEYLRWEPTQYVQAVDPAKPPEPEPARPEPEPQVEQSPPPPPPPTNGREKTAAQPAVAPGDASLTLRHPERDAVPGERLAIGVEPGQRERVLAMVRNASQIVDNYDLRVDGLPEGWWSIYPDTVYLVPYGSSGTYEQEVEIHLHPPRSPEAEARVWELRVTAQSKAQGRDVASEPLSLAIQPYTESRTKVRPERKKGRRKADFTVDVANQANAPAIFALEGSDPDGELEFGFDRPPAEIAPGQTVQTTMRVRPPKQIWIGRGTERRFEVRTLTGEEAAQRLAAQPEAAAAGPSPTAKRGRFGFTQARVFKPQVYEPGLQVGPGGVNLRAPQLQAPQFQAPQLQAQNFQLSNLRGGGAAAAPAGPLLPTQGVLRQRAWLPWWLIPVLGLLAALAVLLYLLLPKNVTVPDVVGAKSTFDAEKVLVDKDLKAADQTKPKVTNDADPGTVIGQVPAAGEKAEKGSAVTLQVAVGSGEATVPNIVGKTATEADQVLRKRKLTLGQASPQPLDPAKKISSQIPPANQVVKEGTPVNIFFPEAGNGTGGDNGNGGGGGPSSGGGGGDVTIPAINGASSQDFAQTISDLKLVPEAKTVFDASKAGTLFATEPAAGETVKQGTKVALLVSGGFPAVVYDDDRDILRVNGANGDKLSPVSKGPGLEKDPTVSPDGTRVAFTRDGKVFLADLSKPNSTPKALTSGDDHYADLAWAPTTDADVLAMDKATGTDTDLCFGAIEGGQMTPQCLTEPDVRIGSAIHWATNGRSIFATGGKNPNTGEFGVVRWRATTPFSSDPGDWGPGRFVSNTDTPNEGTREAVLSPDGKTLAVVALKGRGQFELYLTKPGNFDVTNAKSTGIAACKVAWQPDSRGLVIVQLGATCEGQGTGPLVHVPLDDPQKQANLKVQGDNPAFQPLPGG